MKKLFIVAVLSLVFLASIKAQWTQLGTPHGLPSYGERIEAIGTIDKNVVFSSAVNGIYVSEMMEKIGEDLTEFIRLRRILADRQR